jgi:hypothetical protein
VDPLGRIRVGEFPRTKIMDLTQLIVAEKMLAFMGAVATGTAGGSAYNVVKCYRRCVQAKARRMRFA